MDVATGGPARLLPAACPASDPQPDPTGSRIAYLHAGAVRVIGADGSGDRLVAAPDGPDVRFGVGVHTDAGRGRWWAPDGERLLVARVDWTAVGRWHLGGSTDPAAAPHTVRYAAAGTANAVVTLQIISLGGTRTDVDADREQFEYVVGAGWDAHGPYVTVQSRDQRTVRFLAVDPASGRTRLLAEQRDPCWVQLVPGLPARTVAGNVLSHLDRDGTRHLAVDGVAVTPRGLQLRAVLDIDRDGVVFTASDDPTQTHLWRWQPDGGAQQLSTDPGVHAGVYRGATLVQVSRGPAEPDERAVVIRPDRSAVPIRSFGERPALAVHVRRLVLGPRELRAELYLPSWQVRASGPLPVLLDPYGGAGRQRVTAGMEWRALVSQWFAEQGFAVLVIDGAGTPGRGPAWEREVHGDLFGPVLEDQLGGLAAAAARHPQLDLDRVGIRGWSYGGALAATAVLHRPDVVHAAVAGAGVSDQQLYDAHWRERFLGHPAQFPQRYAAASTIAAAPGLVRPLLLVHGLDDENVHPANTLRLSAALLAAGRPHEVLLLPGVGHQALGSAGAEHLLAHEAAFLRRHLGAAAPPTPAASG